MQGPFFDLENFLDGPLVKNIAAYPVYRIRGITDNSTAAELFGYLLDAPWLRIIWIN